MKARIIFCLALFMAVTACRPKEQATLTLLSPEWSQPDELPRAQHLLQQFTGETGIRVRHLPNPETTLSQLQLSRKLLEEGKSTPDVLAIDVIWPGALEEHLIDLRPHFAAEISAMDPKLIASYTVGGKLVAVPYHAHVGVLEYRTDLLREYGYEHPPTTWEELERMAERIQTGERAKGKKDFWGYLWPGSASESLTCNALEWQVAEGGGQIIEEDGTISVNNPAAIRAWQRAQRWIGWISPSSVVAYRDLDTMNRFDSGGTAFRRTWQWKQRLANWRSSLPASKTGYTSMPGGPAGRVGTLGGTGLAISRHSTHRQEAIKLVRFLIRTELQTQQQAPGTKTTAQPEIHDLPELLQSSARTGEANRAKSIVVSRPSNKTGRAYEEVTKAYITAVHSVLSGKKAAPRAAAELERELIRITRLKAGPPKAGLVAAPTDARGNSLLGKSAFK